MPSLPFFGQSETSGANLWGATSRLINLYPQPLGNRRVLRTVLGTEDFSSPAGTYCREMAEVEGRLYVVQQSTLSEVGPSGSLTTIGAVGGDPNCTISGNNGKVTIVSKGDYYVYDGAELVTPSGGAFSDFGSVEFFAQLTVLTEEGGRRVQWTEPGRPAELDALDFASAEAEDDNILRAMTVGPELWVFGERSIERWSSTSAGGLAAIPGTKISVGLKSFNLATKIPDGAFFIGTDNIAYLAAGGAAQAVSSSGVNYSLSNEAAHRVVYYEDEGQKFCAIVFTDRPAWVFDFATGEWHERSSRTTSGAWEARAAASAYGAFFIGTDVDGIKKFVRTNKDGENPIIRRAISQTIEADKPFRVAEIVLTGRVGWAGLNPDTDTSTPVMDAGDGEAVDSGDGSAIELFKEQVADDAEKIEIRVSKDKGHTWGNSQYRSVGFFGEYDRRVSIRSLGACRNLTVEVIMSREVEFSMDSAVEVRAA